MVVRQLEQQVKSILDAIATDESKKRELIRGDAVDKAEQLSESLPRQHSWINSAMMSLYLEQVRIIQEKLDAFKDSLSNQQMRQGQ